jgi:ketosteroid isomerase-like protein
MYAWIVARKVRDGFARMGEGDPEPVLKMFRDGSHFVFPGDHSWALDTTDREKIAAWFHRFTSLHPQFIIHDVVVKGPPWNTRVCTRGEDRIQLETGALYTNQWSQFARLSWGRIQEDLIYIDTQRLAAVDKVLAPTSG